MTDMRKYFYSDGTEKFGPYSFEELSSKTLNRNTQIWYLGLDKWVLISEVEELKDLLKKIPPPINQKPSLGPPPLSIPEKFIPIPENYEITKKRNAFILKVTIIVVAIVTVLIIIGRLTTESYGNDAALYQKVVESSFETDEDFNFYVEKFFRDAEAFSLFPRKPSNTIIKFAKFDQIEGLTHYHGISFGFDNDDKIEIYINPSTWKKFDKPKKYYLMYHELAHDVLNVDDLTDDEKNRGKLMFPAIETYERITMDDFIESSHALFEEVLDDYL